MIQYTVGYITKVILEMGQLPKMDPSSNAQPCRKIILVAPMVKW